MTILVKTVKLKAWKWPWSQVNSNTEIRSRWFSETFAHYC